MRQTAPPPPSWEDEIEMIRLSVFYPSTEGATFDHDYYRNQHIPLCVKTWGLDGAEIDKGLDGPNVAAVHFKFLCRRVAGSNGRRGDSQHPGGCPELHLDRART